MVKYCVKCGNPVNPNNKFCTKCGAKIIEKYNETDFEENKYEASPKTNNKIILIICIIVAISIAAIIAVHLNNNSPEDISDSNGEDDSNDISIIEESFIGEAVMNIKWYHTIKTDNSRNIEYFTFVFRDNGTLDFQNWKDGTSYSIEDDSVEYSFTETENEYSWILEYSGDFINEEDNNIDDDYYSGKIECEYDENQGIITMIPLSGELLSGYSESKPFVIADNEYDELSIEYETGTQTDKLSLTQSEAKSISNQVLSDYIDAYIYDFNEGEYSSLASIVESGSDFEIDKIDWINKGYFYEEIVEYGLESVSIINNECIHATSKETYYVYGKDDDDDYYITQKATYVIHKQSDGKWKISDYKGGVENLNKEYL